MRKRFIQLVIGFCIVILGFCDQSIAQSFIDPQVKFVVQSALQNNKGLQLKAFEADKVGLEAAAVAAKKLPQVSAMGLYGYMHSNGSIDLPTLSSPILGIELFDGATDFRLNSQMAFAGVSVKQVIFTGLQIPNAQRALHEKKAAQHFLLDAGRESLVKDIANTFDQLMLLTEVATLIADSEKRLYREQQKVNKAIENGLAIPYDRDKLALAILELDEKKAELNGNRELLQKKLQQESALSHSEISAIHYTLSPVYLSELPQTVEERAELKALEASSRAYGYLYKKERGAALPTVFGFGSANYFNLFNSNISIKDRPVFGDINLRSNHLSGSPNLFVGLGVKWELYTGGQHRNKVKQVELDQAITATKYQEASEKLNLLLEKNKVTYRTANEKLKVGQQQMKIAENNLRLASRQLEEGLIDVTEFLAAENDYYKVNLSYFSHVLEQRAAVLELIHTSGTLLQTIHD